jgi:hypothetical protein
MLFLAQTAVGGGILAGLAGLVSFVSVFLFFYAIICILLPVFIYRIMRNGTRSQETLERIERLLAGDKSPESGNDRLRNLAALIAKNEEPHSSISYKGNLGQEQSTIPAMRTLEELDTK